MGGKCKVMPSTTSAGKPKIGGNVVSAALCEALRIIGPANEPPYINLRKRTLGILLAG